MLIFTQHLTSIEVCTRGADGALVTIGEAHVDHIPSHGGLNTIGPPGGDVRAHRAALAALAHRAATVAKRDVDADCSVDSGGSSDMNGKDGTNGKDDMNGVDGTPEAWRHVPTTASPLVYELHLRVAHAIPVVGQATHQSTARHERWLMCGGVFESDEAQLLTKALDQPAAWASVALPLHAAVSGKAFCFLPLPLHTGLPGHVNACFALTSNRRE